MAFPPRLCHSLSVPYCKPQGALGTIFKPFKVYYEVYYGVLFCASSAPPVYILKTLASASSFPESGKSEQRTSPGWGFGPARGCSRNACCCGMKERSLRSRCSLWVHNYAPGSLKPWVGSSETASLVPALHLGHRPRSGSSNSRCRNVAEPGDAERAAQTAGIFSPAHPTPLDFLLRKHPPGSETEREELPLPGPRRGMAAQVRQRLHFGGDRPGCQLWERVPEFSEAGMDAAAPCFPGEAPHQWLSATEAPGEGEKELFG